MAGSVTESTVDWVGNQLKRYALYRFQRFAAVPLRELKAPSAEFCRVPAAFITLTLQYQREILGWLDRHEPEFLQFFMQQSIAFIHNKNQFLVIGEPETAQLRAEYAGFLEDYRSVLTGQNQRDRLSGQVQEMLALHHVRLEQFTTDLFTVNLGQNADLSEPVCSCYSPALQLQVLHAADQSLREPILDLGCGLTAALVQFLRQQGRQAFGVDRSPTASPLIIHNDWLSLPLIPEFWGTVISHMAFSTHFLHHYLRGGQWMEQYAHRYMEILAALQPGGSFLYTPGLPFIEDLLPQEAYQVERFAIAPRSTLPIDRYFQAHGLEVLYAARVTRR